MKRKINLIINFRLYTLIVISLCFTDCNRKEKQIIYTEQYLDNTKNIIQIIYESHIKEFDDIQIIKYLPKYFPRKNVNFRPGPPPNNSILFPEIEKEVLKVNYISTDIDTKFFNLHELNSQPLRLNEKQIDYKKPYLFFKQPIFNKNYDLAWVQYGLYCGSLCAFESIVILKRENNKWMIIFNELLYVS